MEASLTKLLGVKCAEVLRKRILSNMILTPTLALARGTNRQLLHWVDNL